MSFMDTLGCIALGTIEFMNTMVDVSAQHKVTEQLVNRLGNDAILSGAKSVYISIDGVTKEFKNDGTTTTTNAPSSPSRVTRHVSKMDTVQTLFDKACIRCGKVYRDATCTLTVDTEKIVISDGRCNTITLTFVSYAGTQVDIMAYNKDRVHAMQINYKTYNRSGTASCMFSAPLSDVDLSAFLPDHFLHTDKMQGLLFQLAK